jgi:hypothetical protein
MRTENMLYVLLYFLRGKMIAVVECCEQAKEIIYQDISDENKLIQINRLVQNCGFIETAVEDNLTEIKSNRLNIDYDYEVTFISELIEVRCLRGEQLYFETILN